MQHIPLKMRRKPSSAMNLAVDFIDNEAWYIKKVSGSGVTKALIIARHGTKQRALDEILRLPSLSPKKGRSVDSSEFYAVDESNARTPQAYEDVSEDLEDVENMTLQEMQSLLRKGSSKNLLPNATPPILSNLVCPMNYASSLHDEGSLIDLELLWEDSTSNSTDTSDTVSIGGNSSSCEAQGGLMHHLGGHVSDNGNVAEEKERGFTDSAPSVDENDGWTLQMWQKTYQRKHLCHQRSSQSPENNDKVLQDGPCKASSVLQLGTTQTDCSQGRSTAETSKPVEDNSGPNISGSREANKGIISPTTLEGARSGASSKVSAPLMIHSSVRLELEDESDMETSTVSPLERLQVGCGSTWALKNCNKLSTYSAASTQAKKVFKPSAQDTQSKVYESSKAQAGIKLSESNDSPFSTKECEAWSGLNAMDSFEMEEECQLKPAKIPCKRKAISPLSQELLLKASRLGDFGSNQEKAGMKSYPHALKGCYLVMGSSKGSVYISKRKTIEVDGHHRANTIEKAVQEEDASNGPFCHIRQKTMYTALKSSKGSNPLEPIPPHAQKTSHALPSPSPSPWQSIDKTRVETPPAQTSSYVPTKGILKSSQGCQGPCSCEDCMSVRARAERAAEFSQCQMQDIEGLAVKLMKDLNILRSIVENRLLQSPSVKHQSSQPAFSLDQVKKATTNALETEETAKKWLIRMARDCNRYCKVMRMQERKLSFADELGGALCHVKVFHSHPKSDSNGGGGGGLFHGEPSEAKECSSSAMQQEPAPVVSVHYES